ncbi:hypothetical protein PG993_014844 [Apiospora rasikravindrae]|uniref:Uncharacterized protein n=1 Tax=Apiospora rasikravindrae TaxID=990691 RepID=A0ABR1RQD2_9PEZI
MESHESTNSPTALPPSPAQHSSASSPAQSEAHDSTSTSKSEGGSLPDATKSPLWQWNLELLMCFLIFSMPFAALGTLLPYRGKPLPQWPFGITINSLLSIYSTILKAATGLVLSSGIAQLQWRWFATRRPLHDAIRYDEATRGPWGSLQIIWAHRLRQPLTALGALLMVLAIAIEPFVQQIPRTVDCSIYMDREEATIPRTNVFGDYPSADTDNRLGAPYNSGVLDLRSAVFDGVRSTGVDPVAQCTTGNCTFPTNFTTLGICHQCNDISSQVTVDSSCLPGYNLRRNKWDHCPENASAAIFTTINDRYMPAYYENDGSRTVSTNFTWADHLSLNLQTGTYYEKPLELFVFMPAHDPKGIMIRALLGETVYSQSRVDLFTGQPITGCEGNATWRCQGHGAAACVLKPCVREYSATVEAGRPKETLVSQSELQINSSGHLEGILDSNCFNSITDWLPEQKHYHYDPKARWQTFNVTRDNQTAMPIYKTLIEKGCLFFYRNPDPFVDGVVSTLYGFGTGMQGKPTGDGLLTPFTGDTSSASEEMLHIYNYGTVDFERMNSIMANMSESLTRFVRLHGEPDHSSPARGLVWRSTACVHVDWWWSAYPLCLAVGTLVFFILVVYIQDHTTPVWKSSPLAWILRGAESRDQGGSIGNISSLPRARKDELEKASRQIGVSLKTGFMQYYQLEELPNEGSEGQIRRREASSMPSLHTS